MTDQHNPHYPEHRPWGATWNAPDPWPICIDCGQPVYLHPDEGWKHL